MKKLIILPFLLFMVSCTSMFAPKVNLEEKYSIQEQDMRNWDETISSIIEKEALIEDWYGGENPVYYLRKSGKMKEKEFNFLQTLPKKKVITEEDRKEFYSLIKKYVRKTSRTFTLKGENLKDPEGLLDKIVAESMGTRMDNPSRHIMEVVASEKERARLVAWSKQEELSEKDLIKFKQLLNKFIGRGEFFDPASWQNREMSERLEKIIEISKRNSLTKDERNNVNAKAMFIAYEEYLSELEKWK